MRIPILNSSYEPNVEAVILLLKALDIKVTNSRVNETIKRHPEYPNLLCISETLEEWNVDHAVVNMHPKNLPNVEVPFLALIWDEENGKDYLVLVEKVNQYENVTYKNGLNRKKITESFSFFAKSYSGVIIMAEANDLSGDKEYKKDRQKDISQTVIWTVFILTIFLVGFNSVFNLSDKVLYSGYKTWYSSLLILKFFGIIISSILIWHLIDSSNPSIKNICQSFSKSDCSSILDGKYSKLFGVVSWSEIGFIYFVGGLLSLLVDFNTIYLISILSLFSISYVFFSIFYQWKIAKQWCTLCLGVQAIFILEFTITVVFLSSLSRMALDYFLFNKIFFSFLIPTLIWLILKPYLMKYQNRKSDSFKFSRLIGRKEVFNLLMENQLNKKNYPENLGIVFGNPLAENTLLKICNPYCKPCSMVHKEMEKLLKNHYDKLKIQIVYLSLTEKTRQLVFHFLALYSQYEKEMCKRALNDWYLNTEKNYQKFIRKYPVKLNGQNNEYKDHINAMNDWCDLMNIKFTPIFYFNGSRLVNDIYQVEDLNHLLKN